MNDLKSVCYHCKRQVVWTVTVRKAVERKNLDGYRVRDSYEERWCLNCVRGIGEPL